MTQVFRFLWSNIGLKVIMAISGTLLSLFLFAHMAGNLLILVSAESYNNYAHMLTSNKLLLYTAEAGLLGLVFAHIVVAIVLTKRNRAARPQAYVVRASSGRSRRSWFSSNMIITGGFVLFFVPYHLWHFKWGPNTPTIQNGIEMRDLAGLVQAEFAQPFEVILYVVAMLVIAGHLLHGVRSLWGTYGVETNKTHQLVYLVSRAFVVLVMGGFAIIPLILFVQSRV